MKMLNISIPPKRALNENGVCKHIHTYGAIEWYGTNDSILYILTKKRSDLAKNFILANLKTKKKK